MQEKNPLIIDLINVEKIIFYNSNLLKLLNPYFSVLILEWKKSKQSSYSRNKTQNCLIDFLNTCSSDHGKIISDYLKVPVSIIPFNNSIIENQEADIDSLHTILKDISNVSLYRNKNKIKITRWK